MRREVNEARWLWRWAVPTAIVAAVGALGYCAGAAL
jgi:hypothetical protein